MKLVPFICFSLTAHLLVGCSSDKAAEEPAIEHLAGGEATSLNSDVQDFSAHSQNLISPNRVERFNKGNQFFEQPWQVAGQEPLNQNGLGPLFNNNACQNCHVRDGRGQAPDGVEIGFDTLLFRTSKSVYSYDEQVQMENGELTNVPDQSFGGQLQHQAIESVDHEVNFDVVYTSRIVEFSDGYTVTLRQPIWHFDEVPNDYLINDDTVFSARVAPSMIGLGLLQLIDESDIQKLADENDANGDGISGRINLVWSHIEEKPVLGRFGWKASLPNLTEQAAAAFHQDMGLTNRFHRQESCLSHQMTCTYAASGTNETADDIDYEVGDEVLADVAFYSHHLAVPVRARAYDENVQNGKAIFNQIGCQNCHVAQFTTGESDEHPELSKQVIFPYTDLLLHDMGPDLADFSRHNGPAPAQALTDFRATTHEWRTPPLWGIGRAKQVNPDVTFLHDGRATTIMEAILWHGGEAEQSKQRVLSLTATEREQLMAFLNDL